MASLAAAVRQYCAPRAGAHTLAETVHLGATAIVRLESPLDHGCTPTLIGRAMLALLIVYALAHTRLRDFTRIVPDRSMNEPLLVIRLSG